MTTATATWPTQAQLSDILQSLGEACDEVLALDLRAYAQVEDVPPSERPPLPTLEQLGSLSRFLVLLASSVEELELYLKTLREAHDMAAIYAVVGEVTDAS